MRRPMEMLVVVFGYLALIAMVHGQDQSGAYFSHIS